MLTGIVSIILGWLCCDTTCSKQGPVQAVVKLSCHLLHDPQMINVSSLSLLQS